MRLLISPRSGQGDGSEWKFLAGPFGGGWTEAGPILCPLQQGKDFPVVWEGRGSQGLALGAPLPHSLPPGSGWGCPG